MRAYVFEIMKVCYIYFNYCMENEDIVVNDGTELLDA